MRNEGGHKKRMVIREALAADFDDIASCVFAAFENSAEVTLVRQLRADKDVLAEWVAQEVDSIVGHVMVSKMTLDPDLAVRCGGVAPLSVTPTYQSCGIGSRLMKTVLAHSRSLDLDALFLLGDPAYYHRFGFQVTGVHSDYPAEYFQAYELRPGCLRGPEVKALYARAFASL